MPAFLVFAARRIVEAMSLVLPLAIPVDPLLAQITDDAGQTVKTRPAARRAVALAPHLTELVFAAGAGDFLVGVTRGSDYPPAAAAIPEIGDASSLDFETVLALRPDLVLAWGSGNRVTDIVRLRKLGLRVLVLEPETLEDVARHLRLIGELFATAVTAERAAAAYTARTSALRRKYASATPVSVLFEIWHQPLITVNRRHVISEVIRLCGGRNVFADLQQLASAVSAEQVYWADAQVVITGSEAADAGIASWRGDTSLRAVRDGRVYSVPADLIARQTPRILDAAEKICMNLDAVRAAKDVRF
ncbi:MAG: cobalamin-binding protein [Burkholderiales bacterium]